MVANDFEYSSVHTRDHTVLFNGAAAEKNFGRWVRHRPSDLHYRALALDQPCQTMRYAHKLGAWRKP